MNTYKLYLHTFPNGKHYVGITSAEDPNKRWRNGKGYDERQPLMRNAIQKYGWNNIQHEILLEGLTKSEAHNREIFYIALFRTTDDRFGYNIASGGESNNKGKDSYSKEYQKEYQQAHREELREKQRNYRKKRCGRYKEYYKEYGKKYYQEHREEIIENAKQYSKKYYETHKEQHMEYVRKYKEEHLEECRKKDRERYWEKKNSINQTT